MVMHVKWQDVGCGINVELGVCEQVIRGGTTAVTHSGGGAIREEEVRSLCMQTNNPKHTWDLFEFACPLLKAITDLH